MDGGEASSLGILSSSLLGACSSLIAGPARSWIEYRAFKRNGTLLDEGFGEVWEEGLRAMMVLLVKQVHLQKEVGATGESCQLSVW